MTLLRARRQLLRLRLRSLGQGLDPAGAFLLAHHTAWFAVLLLPGDTIRPAPPGQPNSMATFVALGGDIALAAAYAFLVVLAAIGVLRLSLQTDVQRGCLLTVLAFSVGLAVIYLLGNPVSVVAWDALLRAQLAWWVYTAIDRDD